ncbi:MAG TPA: hypothetical protein VIB79_13315 [Candidatus Binatia bacterium]|jgi:Spy/CpxP family protein refolding chaperone
MRKAVFAAALLSAIAAFSQITLAQTKAGGSDKPASNLEIIHEKLKADKKFIVAKYMELTEAEAQKFWPVYDEYQQDLQRSNDRIAKLLESYAADYKGNSFTDEKAKKLLDDWIAIEKDESQRRSTFAPKVLSALPPKKAARYLQIENEYRILLRYQLAAAVPLAK